MSIMSVELNDCCSNGEVIIENVCSNDMVLDSSFALQNIDSNDSVSSETDHDNNGPRQANLCLRAFRHDTF